MDINDVTEKRENTLEVFSTLIMIAGVISFIAGIILAINLKDFIFAVYGLSIFSSVYIIYNIIMTLVENHCMLRHITEENIEKMQNKQDETKRIQKEEEEKNEQDLQKIIDAYSKHS